MPQLEEKLMIAKFMGYEQGSLKGLWVLPIHLLSTGLPKHVFHGDNHSSFNFDSDWNMLMPVVEKIEQTTTFNVGIHYCYCQVFDPYKKEKIASGGGDTKIEAVYTAVVEFIKYLNNN